MICDHCDRLVTSCKKSARHSRNFLRFVCLFICLVCFSLPLFWFHRKKTSQKIQSQVTRSTGIAYSTYCKVPQEVESHLYSGNWFRRFSFYIFLRACGFVLGCSWAPCLETVCYSPEKEMVMLVQLPWHCEKGFDLEFVGGYQKRCSAATPYFYWGISDGF